MFLILFAVFLSGSEKLEIEEYMQHVGVYF